MGSVEVEKKSEESEEQYEQDVSAIKDYPIGHGPLVYWDVDLETYTEPVQPEF